MTGTELTTLWLGAFRYYLGRRTYAVQQFTDLLTKEWDSLDHDTQVMIRIELNREFYLDDQSRENNEQNHPLGDNCDRESWEQVRGLWA